MTYRPKNTKERILHRIKIALGHLRKVQDMIESDEYCIDVIHQSQAVQNALKEIDVLTLESHLHGCVASAIREGKKDTAIQEVITIFKKQRA